MASEGYALTDDNCNGRIFGYLWEAAENPAISIRALQGARRSGKTYTTCQFLLLRALCWGESIVVASMTAEQGRAGAYDDMRTILNDAPESYSQYFEIMKSPREIRCIAKGKNGRCGVISFRSFLDPETAKGAACDWVFMNEANKFSKQQYLDLSANARQGVILDYNPQKHFWIDDEDVEVLRCTWQENRTHLTPAQIQWFENIEKAAHRDGATAADIYYYQVYYCGEYCGLSGQIFTRQNIDIRTGIPDNLQSPLVFCDPSALRGADWFAIVLVAMDLQGDMWVLDVDSKNTGTREERLKAIRKLAGQWDNTRVYIETNGIIGQEFAEFCQDEQLEFVPYCSRKNKFERIIAHYEDITRKVHFVDSIQMTKFLEQVYEFSEECEHDDNIDAVNSAWMIEQAMNF